MTGTERVLSEAGETVSPPPAAGGSADDRHAVGETPPASDSTPVDVGPPPPIRPSDRLCSIGMTGSGKSVSLNALWAIYPGQRLLIDVNDEYELGPAAQADEAGAIKVEKLSELDWRARTIHVVPRSLSESYWDDLYAAIFARGNLCVALHESYGPTTANRTPRSIGLVLRQGRKRNILHLAASQEPMNIAPVIYSQADHLLVFRLTGRPDELARLAPRLQLRPDELAAELEQLQARFGEHAYLRATVRDSHVRRMPPLPADVIDYTGRHVISA